MSKTTKYGNLAERVLDFLEVNQTVTLSALKHHLNCRASDLLISVGILFSDRKVSVSSEGLEKRVSLLKEDAEKED